MIVFMGPTASGKSALALRYAKKHDGEIVSVDSMQLYRGLEIGTAQPTAAERTEVPHHLVGIRELSQRTDVYTFLKLAERAIASIEARGKIPVLAGGTGLYLKALLYGLDDLPADPVLRAELDARYDRDDAEPALCEKLAELDPAGLAKYGNCRRRLIRALEVRMLAGESIVVLQGRNPPRLRPGVTAWKIEIPPDELRERIARRALAMLENGWIEEARAALAAGLLSSPTAHQALGYRLIGEFLAGKLTFQELETRIVVATGQFARRQRTWFRHQHPEAESIRDPEAFLV